MPYFEGGFEGSASREPSDSSCPGGSSSCINDASSFECNICFDLDDASSFECNICFDLAQDPIVTLCGHLYCWPCLYQWLHGHAHSSECPVCKAIVEEDKLVPIFGRGKASADPRKADPGVGIPNRPAGQRPATAQPPDMSQFANAIPWFIGGIPLIGATLGNYTFSAAIGGLIPLLGFQVHGLPDAAAYGPVATGFPYGFHTHGFHGERAHNYDRHAPQEQQSDVYLKVLLLLVGVLVVASLVWF